MSKAAVGLLAAAAILIVVWRVKNSPAEPTAAHMRRDDLLAAEREEFELVYSVMALPDLEAEYSILQARLEEMTRVPFAEYYRDGKYEVIGRDGPMRIHKHDASGVDCFMIVGETGEHIKITLPESGFPDAYALNRRVKWVYAELVKKRHQQARQQVSASEQSERD